MSAVARVVRPRGIITPRRSLVRPHVDIWHYDSDRSEKRILNRGRYPNAFRTYSFNKELRATYQGAPGSRRYGRHYGGPQGAAFTRELFLIANGDPGGNVWISPTTSIDILMVGGGGGSLFALDGIFGFPIPASGGGGGAAKVVLGVAVLLGNSYNVVVGSGSTGSGLYSRLITTFGGVQIAGRGGGGGNSPNPSSTAAGNGENDNGNGGGGTWDNFIADAPVPGGTGVGTGNPGGNGFGPAAGVNAAGAGGGGIGAAGGNAGFNVGGVGGAGAIPAPHTFGAWGTDIGENGFFGGGGGGRNDGGGGAWTIAAAGVGNGAVNTGGGGSPAAFPSIADVAGFDGMVAIVYATP